MRRLIFNKFFRRSAESRVSGQSGQVLLFSVLILSGALLSVTVIAGLLTLYQLRQAGDVARSAQAIYAADAGLEMEFYRWFKDFDNCHAPSADLFVVPGSYPTTPACFTIANPLINGAQFVTLIEYRPGSGSLPVTLGVIRSTGQSARSFRAFRADF